MYSCTVLAIDAQGKQIQTLEGIAQGRNPHPIVNAFVENDAQQCGYCTPGFVVASKAFLDKNPNPTYEQVKEGLGGNLCRCGTYVGIRKAVLEAASQMKGEDAMPNYSWPGIGKAKDHRQAHQPPGRTRQIQRPGEVPVGS